MFFLGMGIMWLLSLGAILLTIGLAINAVWRAVMPPAGLPAGAACGSCGYELGTLGEGRCPECGADLMKAGVMTRRNAVRLSGSLPGAIMGWTVVCVVLGGVTMGIVSSVMMARTMNTAGAGTMPYSSSTVFRPQSYYDQDAGSMTRSADYEITLDLDVVASPSGAATSGTVTITIEHEGEEAVIDMDAATGDWTLTAPDGAEIASGSDLGKADTLAAYGAVGLDTAQTESLDTEAEQLVVLAAGALSDPWSYTFTALPNTQMAQSTDAPPGGLTQASTTSNVGGVMGMGGNSTREIVAVLAVFGALALVWIVGVVLITRRRASVVRGPRPTPA